MAHPCYGTPSGCRARCTPSAMYMAHTYYVPGTPILWHNLHTVQTPRSDAPFRRPCTHCTAHKDGARKGVLAAGRVSVKARRCGLHVPRNGSGEPARA